MQEDLGNLDATRTFLYAPVDGPRPLREAWLARQRNIASDTDTPASLPVVTHGLTHGLSLVAALFADADTDVVVPGPSWGNYRLVFSLHAGARILSYPFYREGRFNVEGLADTLQQVRSKAIVVLNFPGNPTGYAPTATEVPGIVEVLARHQGPAVVVTDDAYQRWVYEDDCLDHSLFWQLSKRLDRDRNLVLKVDGATKELVFFGSRVGFLTHNAPEGDEALESKLKCVIRGTVGSASGPALSMVERALAHPDLEAGFKARLALMERRYRTLKDGLEQVPGATPYPFNAAFFALVRLDARFDAHEVRKRLLAEHSIGTIAFPDNQALRIAYCSLDERDLPELVRRLAVALA
jgi:aspartate/methionine/tyrosine aminotransferase